MGNMRTDRSKLENIQISIFSTKHARECDISSYELSLMISEGLIESLEKGIYSKADCPVDENREMIIALVRIGDPSCVSLLSALYYHGLTDRIPDQTWLFVPYKKTTRNLNVKLIRKREIDWEVGIESVGQLKVTSIERTLIDCLCDRKHFTELDAIKYMKEAIADKMTTPRKLLDMAKMLNVAHRVKLTIGIFEE
jgi:predicted transcriptional regulator of viral defense system